MNNKVNYIKYILCVSLFLVLRNGFVYTSLASYTCTVAPGESGCCTTCTTWTNICFGPYDPVPTRCDVPEGQCKCDLGFPGYCNSYEFPTPGCPRTHQCDSCCCNLPGGGGGGSGNWYGVLGRVWSDFNNNGGWDWGESWVGLPKYDTDGRCDPVGNHQNDFEIIVNGENIARAWWCIGTPRIHTTQFEYYSHHDDHPGWSGLNAGMSRGNYYTATLSNLPSGSGCGTWSVYNSDGSLQGNGSGCNASFLMTALNNYMRIEWKLGPAGCTSNADCNDSLFCTDDVCTAGVCSHPAKSCDDSNACTTDSCDEANDRCINTNNPVNGGWSAWGACVNCSQSRTCTNPSPKCGGAYCTGPSTQACGRVDGTLGPWGTCSNGSQTSRCLGYRCGGSCSTECSGAGGIYNLSNHTCTRPCLRVEGNIWSDDNRNGVQDIGESWKGSNALSCTEKFWNGFSISEPSELGNLASSWWCHGTNNFSYYNSLNQIEPESYKVYTLSSSRLPLYSKCGFWKYRNSQYGDNLASGPGCVTGNLRMPTSGWLNVNFELCKGIWVDSAQCDTLCGPGKLIRTCQWSNSRCTGTPTCDPTILPTGCNRGVCHYTLVPTVRKMLPEMTLPGECPSPSGWGGYDLLGGARVTVQSISPGGYNQTKVTAANGKTSFDVPYTYRQVAFTSNTTTGGVEPETYSLKCPGLSPYIYPIPEFSYNVWDTIPWYGTYPSYSLNLGVQASPKYGWVSAIDSDIFAQQLSVDVPAGPTDNSNSGQTPQGFAKTLINSSGNTDRYLGFAFSEAGGTSNSPSDTRKIFETKSGNTLGGNAYNLHGNSKEHDSEWLKNFTFTPPSNVENLSSLPTSFSSDKIYRITGGKFNDKLDDGSFAYSITGDNDISVLYVDGDVNISNSITTSSSTRRLLIVVNGSVTVSKDVGTDTGFNMSNDPNIEAGIIASGAITFPSKNNDRKTETNRDKPIMVSAPLISKTGISFERDLYHTYNATMPAESAKAYNKYLYLLTSLEREKSEDNLYFTGLTTYDLDWEYIY